MSVENIVAERERHRRLADELPADDERLREPFGPWLHGVLDLQSEVTAVTEKPAEAVDVGGRRNEQDVPNPRQHERRQRVIDHRLVVNREELLRDDESQRTEAGSSPAGKKYPFHLAESLEQLGRRRRSA